jgi:Glycosyl hydrolases family 2
MNFKKTLIAMMAIVTLAIFCQGEEPAIKFGFKERLPDCGMIKNKGSIRFSATVKSKSKSSSNCFTSTDNGPGFIIGTKEHNYVEIETKPEVEKLLSGGFKIKIGYIPSANLANQPKNSVLVLVAKYDHGLQARSFALFTGPNGNVTFTVSNDGKKTISCARRLVTRGKRVEFEAHFVPGKMIALYQNGKKMASKKIDFNQIYQSDQPMTVGARMFNKKTPINFGVGIIDLLEISKLDSSVTTKKKSLSEVASSKKKTITVNNSEISTVKFERNNQQRGELCLNGLWNWQPFIQSNSKQPDEQHWLKRRVPFYRKSSFSITDSSGTKVKQYKGKKLKGTEKSWIGTDISIPASWQGRDIFLELDGVAGKAPVVAINGKNMLISPNLPYKFPLKYTSQLIKLRIKSDAVKQNIWLKSYPRIGSIRFAGVSPSWRNKNLQVLLEGTCQANEKLLARIVIASGPDMKKNVIPSQWFDIDTANKTFSKKFVMLWQNPKLWTPDTPNLYYFRIELQDNAGKVVDATFPLRFGFRELWVEDGQLKLNGMPINIRGNNHTPFGSQPNYASFISNRKNIKFMLSKWKKELNLNAFFVWSGEKYDIADRTKVCDVADEVGLLINFQLPYGQKDFSTSPAVARYNQRLLKGEIRRYANHPSIFTWGLGSSHYTWICSPALLGQQFEPEKYWDKIRKDTAYGLPLKKVIKELDPSRVVTTHSGGHNKVSDLLTGMVYINPDAGLQERANWPLAWWKNRKKLKPLYLTEVSCIFWATMYQRKAANSFPSQSSEPIFLEHGAELFGDKVYQDEPDKYIEQYFGKNKAVSLFWQKNPAPTAWKFKQEYLKYAYRAWRTFGVGFMLHVELRTAFNNRRFLNTASNQNINSPGGHPNVQLNSNDSVGDLNSWGEIVQKQLAPFYAYIGGDGNFTSQDHAYYSGEKITKRAVVLNDHFYSLPVKIDWKLLDSKGKIILKQSYKKSISGGERVLDDFSWQFTAPQVTKKTVYTLLLTATAKGKIRKDKFQLQIYPRIKNNRNAQISLQIFDPVGDTTNMLKKAGFNLKKIKNILPNRGILVIGRHVLEKGINVKKLARMGFDKKVKEGLKVVVFEQACSNILGLKAYENSPRRTFISASGHPVLKGINAPDIWHWSGASDIIEAYPVPKKIPTAAGGWFPERFWKWGNGNNVATYVIQKPMFGAFRALIDCGFDLMDTPLLESCIGKGRFIFCQMDVTNRYAIDPAATQLVDNIFAYMNEVPFPNAKLVEVKYSKGPITFDGFRMKKPSKKLGWGLNNGDFYFRQQIKVPAFKTPKGAQLVKMTNTRAIISCKFNDFNNNWQRYKYLKILAALRMNQGGSSDTGPAVELHGDSDELYPLNWHFGFIHPYTGWCW